MSVNSNDEYYRSLLSEIQQLRLTISDLSEQNRTLSAQNSELITKTQGYLHIEIQNRQLQNDIKDKEEKIIQLEKDKMEMQRLKIAEIREIELEHLREITYYKNQQENNIQKIETANVIIKLNENQHKRILELEKEIEDMIKAENEQQRQNEIKHQNQFTNLKKKMMDHIKTAQKNMAQSNLDNLDLNTKLSKLTTNQLLIELEEQSTQIEDLLKIKERYEKEIFALKTDLNTHKKVEQVLQDKNKKYLEMVRKVDKKLELHKETLESNNSYNNTHTQGNNNNNNITYTVPNYRNANTTTIAMSKRHYEKMYNKQNKEFHFLRDKYETFKEKHKMYEQKHAGVINLYNMAIDKLIEDDEIKNIHDIHANVNKIKNGEFNAFNKQEQYTVLTLLIKHLLPLINESANCSSNVNNGKYESAANVKDQFSTVLINQNLFNKNNITMTTFQEGSSNINKNTMNRTTNSFNPKGKMFNNGGSNSNNKTYTKFPKIEHLQLDSAKKRGHTPLYKILSIK